MVDRTLKSNYYYYYNKGCLNAVLRLTCLISVAAVC